jgi:hypothetical protein
MPNKDGFRLERICVGTQEKGAFRDQISTGIHMKKSSYA